MSEMCETKIYNLIAAADTAEAPPPLFVLINPYEINILRENKINIRGITLHQYDRWEPKYYAILDHYQSLDYAGDIYLLGRGEIHDYMLRDLKKTNIHVELDFNCLKYISKYSGEILPQSTATEPHQNEIFVQKLKTEYMTSIFYCELNTGIVGVDGYLNFHADFYKYLDTINTIYIINGNSRYTYSDFHRFIVKTPEYAQKIQYLKVDICDLYRTNPELIAYYRIEIGDRENYLDRHFHFSHTMSCITDQIIIGNDSYKYHDYGKKKQLNGWLLEHKITHIINVSTDIIEFSGGAEGATYEHYPINELKEKCNINKSNIFRAVDRLHEIIQQNRKNKVYVHCSLGMNRSPTVVLLYFIKYCRMTLYDAFKTISLRRQIFTSVDLFNTIYSVAKEMGVADISPLKMRTNYVYNFCQPHAYYFALYDSMYLEALSRAGHVVR